MNSAGKLVHPPEEILIFMTITGGISMCRSALRELGLKSHDNFLTFTGTGGLEEAVYDDRPQLLITDSWIGEMKPILELIVAFRKKNPQLVAVLFGTVSSQSPEFDRTICTMKEDDWHEKIVAAVRDFREGNLRRT